jgi:hypothetical protein
VAHLGVDNALWSDHTNIQPTMMALLGLHDDYAPDGRVLSEIFTSAAVPARMRPDRPALLALGRVYTQIEAPVGAFGLDTLKASTGALASHSTGDTIYSGSSRNSSGWAPSATPSGTGCGRCCSAPPSTASRWIAAWPPGSSGRASG